MSTMYFVFYFRGLVTNHHVKTTKHLSRHYGVPKARKIETCSCYSLIQGAGAGLAEVLRKNRQSGQHHQ